MAEQQPELQEDIHVPNVHYASPFVIGWRTAAGRYRTQGKKENADCILAFAFGYRVVEGEIEPGPPNEALAKYVKDLNMDVPVIAQFEIDEALGNTADCRIEPDKVEEKVEANSAVFSQIDSHGVLMKAMAYMHENGLKNPLLVAQKHHMPRVHAMVVRHGIEPVVLEGLPDVWDEESAQTWIHDHLHWLREEAVIGFYRLKGYI